MKMKIQKLENKLRRLDLNPKNVLPYKTRSQIFYDKVNQNIKIKIFHHFIKEWFSVVISLTKHKPRWKIVELKAWET